MLEFVGSEVIVLLVIVSMLEFWGDFSFVHSILFYASEELASFAFLAAGADF